MLASRSFLHHFSLGPQNFTLCLLHLYHRLPSKKKKKKKHAIRRKNVTSQHKDTLLGCDSYLTNLGLILNLQWPSRSSFL